MKELFFGKRDVLLSWRLLSASAVAPDVAELARKLWAGFSRQALEDLDAIVRATRPGRQKTLAAWESARFHASKAQWQRALDCLEVIHGVDKEFLRRNGAGVLRVQALVACGRPDEAEHHAHQMMQHHELSSDYNCALSNAVAPPAMQQKDTSDFQPTRLALLNNLYADAGLAEVGLVDAARGFVFGNLAVAEERLSEVHRPQMISVLMTVSNATSSVSTAVASILGQTWRNVELVVVDNAGTGASWDLVERFARKDPRVIHVRNATDGGMYEARNRALALANGHFIAVYDSACWAHPQMLHVQVQAMLDDPEIKLAFPSAACVSPDMKYSLRLDETNTEYVHRNYRSYLVRTRDLQFLDRWDSVTAHADEEFVERCRMIWGDRALRDVLPNVPVSLCLGRSPELQLDTEPRSLNAGVRHEYAKQAEFWRKNVLAPANEAGQSIPMERVSTKRPFPIPSALAPGNWPENRHYDVIIISDLTLLGGTRRCNEGYIAAATNLKMQVGLLHWARYDLKLIDDIASEYRTLSYRENVDILTAEDRVSADLVLIHHPPIMKYLPDAVPKISTERLAILVNQLPQRLGEEGDAYYREPDVKAYCSRLFGVPPIWIPISPLVRRVLSESGFAPLAKEDWIPPLGKFAIAGNDARSRRRQRRVPVIGRHSRDHRTKWPEIEKHLRSAYCANTEFAVRFLGGATFARRILRRWPENWEELPFDSMAVSDFLNDLDFFVHFTHSAYVEEFGRNVMEAMAAGIPAVVPPRFREVFGDAACYAEPEGVEELIYTLWHDKSAYLGHVEKGLCFVRGYAANECVERRLQEAKSGAMC